MFSSVPADLGLWIRFLRKIPVFGEGVQYGAPPELERQQLNIHARGLRWDRMKLYGAVITRAVEDWLQDWGANRADASRLVDHPPETGAEFVAPEPAYSLM